MNVMPAFSGSVLVQIDPHHFDERQFEGMGGTGFEPMTFRV